MVESLACSHGRLIKGQALNGGGGRGGGGKGAERKEKNDSGLDHLVCLIPRSSRCWGRKKPFFRGGRKKRWLTSKGGEDGSAKLLRRPTFLERAKPEGVEQGRGRRVGIREAAKERKIRICR